MAKSDEQLQAWYLRRKTLAQGLLDLTLFSTNAGQLKTQVNLYKQDQKSFFVTLFGIIILSLILQATMVAVLLFSYRFEKKEDTINKAIAYNNWVIAAAILIILLNILILGFAEPQMCS